MKKKFKVLFTICNGTPCTNQTDKIEQNLEKTKVLFLIVPCSCDEFRQKELLIFTGVHFNMMFQRVNLYGL